MRKRTGSYVELLFWAGTVLAGLLFFLWFSASRAKAQRERVRAEWAASTLPQLAELTATNPTISAELQMLRAGSTNQPKWAGDHVLLMTNGEHLVYAHRHGVGDHLFLARSSDGRWIYSSFHFCHWMVGLSPEPPGSIAEFQQTYFAREFDGKARNCLERTGRGEPKPPIAGH